MWKDIHGCESHYEINEYGDVRNKRTKRIIRPDINSSGYCRVQLYGRYTASSHKKYLLHRLVAEHFIPNPNHLLEVNHIDGNRKNNTAYNLEWVDRFQNEMHCRRNGGKAYQPFLVTYSNLQREILDTTGQLARTLGVTSQEVKDWLRSRSSSYERYGINEIRYLDCSKSLTTIENYGM